MSSYSSLIKTGLVVSAALLAGLLGWGGFTPLSGAVIVSGSLTSKQEGQVVQHVEGGIVDQILVQEGQKVEAGEVVLTLDETQLQARMDILIARYLQALAQKARLEAERDQQPELEFARPVAAVDEALYAQYQRTQRTLHAARLVALKGEQDQLRQQIVQFEDQQLGLKNLIAAKQRQNALIATELEGVEDLYEKGHAPYTRVLALQREQAKIQGEIAEHQSQIARMQSAIGEIELKILQSDKQVMERALDQLKETEQEINEALPELLSVKQQLKNLSLRAPVAGYVHELTAHTSGGVITAATPLMRIVPADDQLIVLGQVMPQDIDQIYKGQQATIKLPAFDQKTTPDLFGTVVRRSADQIVDPNSQAVYFEVELSIPADQIARLGDDKILQPGMPAEGYIQTTQRTALNYILKPLLSQWDKALQEQ